MRFGGVLKWDVAEPEGTDSQGWWSKKRLPEGTRVERRQEESRRDRGIGRMGRAQRRSDELDGLDEREGIG